MRKPGERPGCRVGDCRNNRQCRIELQACG
jgi:hypothetical protein